MECLINGYVPTELMINGKVISGCAKGGNVVYRKKNAIIATNYGDDIITTNDTVYAQIKNLNIYGKSTVEDDVISSVGDSGNIMVASNTGANLLDIVEITTTTGEATYIVNNIAKNSDVILHGIESSSSYHWTYVDGILDDGTSETIVARTNFTMNRYFNTGDYTQLRIGVPLYTETSGELMLQLGTTSADIVDYEPYQGSTQTLTLTEPLRGVPTTLTAYANYTDSDGQMWISDYIDVEEGLRYYKCATGRIINANELHSEDDTYITVVFRSYGNDIIDYSPTLNVTFVTMIHNFPKEDSETFYQASGALIFKIKKSRLATADFDGINQWLEENPTYYCGAYLNISQTPSPVAIDTTELKKLRSYAGQTNLFVSDNAGLKADFRTDLGDKVIKGYILDYIESTGTQWIDTGVTMNNNLEIEAYFAVTTTYNVLNYSGAVLSGYNGWIAYGSYAFNYLVAFFCKQVREGATISFDKEYHYYKLSATEQQIDDTFSYINSGVQNSSTIKLYLFRGNTDFFAKFTLGGKSKFQKIFKSGNLIQQLIPYQTLDGTNCMYDTVTNTTFENQGTGDFLGGEVVGYVTEDNIAYNNDGTLYNPDITTAVMSMGVEPAETQTLQLAQLEELGVTI